MTPAQAKELTVSVVLAAALAVAGGVAAVSGGYFKDEAVKREQLMRRQSLEASGRLSRANEEREQISAYMQRYQNYVRIKAIKPALASADDTTPEQGERLEWIERLVEAREARGLPQMAYAIAARKPYEDIAKPGQGLSFFASRMKLELGLLHEGDFIDYLRRLANPPAGIFVMDRCTLQARAVDTARTPVKKPAPGAMAAIGNALGGGTAPATPVDQSNVIATCEIDWITLVEDARAPAAPGSGAAAK